MNVSEFESIDEATESMVAMIQAFKNEGTDTIELSTQIIDKLNNIGNNYSISTSELAESLKRSSGTLIAAGNTIDEAIAMSTAANAIIQDAESTGSALKVLSMRIRGTSAKELETEGEDTEGLIETTSKLEEKVKALTAINGGKGVSLLDDNGNYRSTYQILQDIADIWDDIQEADKADGQNRQAALLEMLAGKTRSQALASLLQNGEMLRSVYEDVQKSEGSAAEEQEKWMQSIEAHIQTLTAKWQELWDDSLTREQITWIIDRLGDILDIVKEIGLVPSLGILSGGLFGLNKLLKGEGLLTKILGAIKAEDKSKTATEIAQTATTDVAHTIDENIIDNISNNAFEQGENIGESFVEGVVNKINDENQYEQIELDLDSMLPEDVVEKRIHEENQKLADSVQSEYKKELHDIKQQEYEDIFKDYEYDEAYYKREREKAERKAERKRKKEEKRNKRKNIDTEETEILNTAPSIEDFKQQGNSVDELTSSVENLIETEENIPDIKDMINIDSDVSDNIDSITDKLENVNNTIEDIGNSASNIEDVGSQMEMIFDDEGNITIADTAANLAHAESENADAAARLNNANATDVETVSESKETILTNEDTAANLAHAESENADAAARLNNANATDVETVSESKETILTNEDTAANLAHAKSENIGTASTLGLSAAFNKLAASVGVSKLALGGIISIIAAVAVAVGYSIYKLYEIPKEIKKAAEEAKKSIDEISSSFNKLKSSTDDIKQRYAELAQGVENLGKVNQSQGRLSTDDYKEFLDISNQLRDLFPQLTIGYTENGDALLNLNGDVNTIVGSLNKLVDTQRELSNIEIMAKMPDLYKGYLQNVKDINNELATRKNEIKEYQDAYNAIMRGEYKWLDSGYEWKLKEILSKSGYYNDEINNQFIAKSQEFLQGKTPTIDLSSINLEDDKVKQSIEGVFNEIIHEINKGIQLTESKLDGEFTSLRQYIYTYLSTDDFFYNSLNQDDKNIINKIIGNLDLSNIKAESWEDLEKYIDTNVVQAISGINDKKIKEQMYNLLFGNLESGQTIGQLYDEIINNLLNQPGFNKQSPLIVYFEAQQTDYENKKNALMKHLTGTLSNIFHSEDEYLEHYDELTPDQYDKLMNLEIPENVHYSWEELMKLIEDTNDDINEISKFNIDNLKRTTDALGSVNSMYKTLQENVKDKKSGSDLSFGISDVEALKDKFVDAEGNKIELEDKQLKLFNEYEKVLTEGTASSEELEDALNGLSTMYADVLLAASDYSDESIQMIKNQMMLNGITEESADEYIKFKKALTNFNTSDENSIISKVKSQIEELSDTYDEAIKKEKELQKLQKYSQYKDVKLDKNGYVGNVDIYNRPVVLNDDGSYSTTSTAMAEYDSKVGHGRKILIHYTPILPNGKELTDEEINKYLDGLIDKATSNSDIMEADKVENGGKGILYQIDTTTTINGEEQPITAENIENAIMQGDAFDVAMHEVQTDIYNGEYELAVDYKVNVNDATSSLIALKTQLGLTNEEFEDYIYYGILSENIKISGDESWLYTLAVALDMDINKLKEIIGLQNMASGKNMAGVPTQYREQLQEQAIKNKIKKQKELYEELELNTPPGGTGGGGGSEEKDILSELNSQLDELQENYNKVKEARETYEKTGKITVDQAQDIINADFRMLAALGKEEDAYKSLGQVKLEELKIQMILNAVDTINSIQSEADAIQYLTGAYKDLAVASADAAMQMLLVAQANAIARGSAQGEAAGVVVQGVQNALSLMSHVDFGFTNENSDSGSSNDSDNKSDAFEHTFDWVETLLEKISKQTQKLTDKVEKFFTWTKKNLAINKAVKQLGKEAETNRKAYYKYIDKANSTGLSASYKKKVQEGALSIEEIYAEGDDAEGAQELVDTVEKYKEWYDKAQDCKDAIEDLYNQQRELIRQKLTNIIDYYSDIDSYLSSIVSKFESLISLNDAMGKRSSLKDLVEQYASIEDLINSANESTISKEYKKSTTSSILTGVEYGAGITEEIKAAEKEAILDEVDNLNEELNRLSDLESTKVYQDLVKSIDKKQAQIDKYLEKNVNSWNDNKENKYQKYLTELENLQKQESELWNNATADNISQYYNLYKKWQSLDNKMNDKLESSEGTKTGLSAYWQKMYDTYTKQLRELRKTGTEEIYGNIDDTDKLLGKNVNYQDNKDYYNSIISEIESSIYDSAVYKDVLAKAEAAYKAAEDMEEKYNNDFNERQQKKYESYLDKFQAFLDKAAYLEEYATSDTAYEVSKIYDKYIALDNRLTDEDAKPLSTGELRNYAKYYSQLEGYKDVKDKQISDLIDTINSLGYEPQTESEKVKNQIDDISNNVKNTKTYLKLLEDINSTEAKIDAYNFIGEDNFNKKQQQDYDKLKKQLDDLYQKKEYFDIGAMSSNIADYQKVYDSWKKLQDKLNKNGNLSVNDWKNYRKYESQLKEYQDERDNLNYELNKQLDNLNNPAADELEEIKRTYEDTYNQINESYKQQEEALKNSYKDTKTYKDLYAKYENLKNNTKRSDKQEKELQKLEAELKALENGATYENIKDYINKWSKIYDLNLKEVSGKALSNAERQTYDTYAAIIDEYNAKKQEEIDTLIDIWSEELENIDQEYESSSSEATSKINDYYAKLYEKAKEIAEYNATQLGYQLEAIKSMIGYYEKLVSLFDTFSGDKLTRILTDLSIFKYDGSSFVLDEEDISKTAKDAYGLYLESLKKEYETTKNQAAAYDALLAALDTEDFDGSLGLFDTLLQDETISEETKASLQRALDLLTERAADALDWGEYADAWEAEWTQSLDELKSSMVDIYGSIQDVQNALREITLKPLMQEIEKLESMSSVLSSIAGFIKEDWLYDENGLTEYGEAKAALLISQIEKAQSTALQYLNKYEELLSNDMKESFSSELEYEKALNEAIQNYYSSLTNVSSLQDQLVEMQKTAANNELEGITKIIEKRKEALNAKKEYYEYDKTLKEQSQNVQDLEAQLNAIEGVYTEEAKAKRAQLQADLKEAQDTLEETTTEHEYELATKALDKLLDDLKEAIENTSTDVEKTIETYIDTLNKMMEAGNITNEQLQTTIDKLIQLLTTGSGMSLYTPKLSESLTGKSFANGTDGEANGSYSGKTLVGEGGYEIWAHDGRYEVVGQNGAEMIDYKDGDYIFNHSQSEKLLKHGKANSQGKSFASGNVDDMFTSRFTRLTSDTVGEFPALIQKLYNNQLSAISTIQINTSVLPDMKNSIDRLINNTGNDININISYDNLLNVEGSVDKSVVDDLTTILDDAYGNFSSRLFSDLKKAGVTRKY